MRRFGLTGALRNDGEAISTYERYHSAVWPEVLEDGRRAGVLRTAIFRDGRVLFMVIDTTDDFDLNEFSAHLTSSRTLEWQEIMDGLLLDQLDSSVGQKWRAMPIVCDVE